MLNGTMDHCEVYLDNVYEGEIFPHELVRLAGHIDNCHFEVPHITIKCTSTTSEYVYDEWRVGTSHRFVAFAQLHNGLNKVLISVLDPTRQVVLGSMKYNLYHYIENINTRDRSVKFLYIICHDSDGSFQNTPGSPNTQDTALNILDFNAKLCQLYYSESLRAFDYKRKSFKLDPTEVFISRYSKDEVKQFKDETFWRFCEELMTSGQVTGKRKLVCVLGCTRYCTDRDVVHCHTAATLGDVAIIGGGCLYSWAENLKLLAPSLSNDQEIERLFNDSAGRGTFGTAYSTTFGSLLHELGHAFNMDHTPTGIMGRGFDDFRDFVLPVKSSTCHPTPYNMCLEWWKMWNGASFHPISLSLLNQHSWMNELNNADTTDCSCDVTHHVDYAMFGEEDVCTSFNIDISRNDEMEFYYDNLLRGIRSGEELVGYKAENVKTVKFKGLVTDVTVRVGTLVDGVSFTARCEGVSLGSGWIGGYGGNIATIHCEKGYTHISGSICKNEKCVKSIAFGCDGEADIAAVRSYVSSEIGIGYLSVFHTPTEIYTFWQDFQREGILPKKLVLDFNSKTKFCELSSKILLIDAEHRLQTFSVPASRSIRLETPDQQ